VLAEAAIALTIPWLKPLSFALNAQGWYVGRSGTVSTTVGRAHAQAPLSTAWAANVRYRDPASSDPPNTTLQHLPPGGVVIWASIQPPTAWPPDHRRVSVHYSLADAYHLACCEAATLGAGEWELYGFGPKRAYSVLIRIFWVRRRRRR
jgi:hypothetical protein